MKTIKSVIFVSILSIAQPLSFLQPLPKQHLVNAKRANIQPTIQLQSLSTDQYGDEQVIVFALQAAVASFLIQNGDLDAYQSRLAKYFNPQISPIVKHMLVPQSGQGICDQAVLFKQSFSALPSATAALSKKIDYWHVDIPMILSNQESLSVSMDIKPNQDPQQPLVVTQFEITQ
ncbi:hypothetical protein OAT84_01830 [Gammaproteobacteria bacterium]|nr:hypothetical protein [Gammaproteobacteria bacterium]